MIELSTPLSKKDISKLRIGQKVLLSGDVFTMRDQASKYLAKNHLKDLEGAVIYHCGPLVKKQRQEYKVVSAGPTTSQRLNIYTPDLIKKYKIPALIGKGGMSQEVAKVLKGKGVYLAAIGGLGAKYAQAIKEVVKVYHLDKFGPTEAIWQFQIEDFPLLVAIDSQGNNLYELVENRSKDNIECIFQEICQ